MSISVARHADWGESRKSAAARHGKNFSWQDGYAAFSVSWTHLVAVRKYIATQEEHHRKTDFVAELKQLLERNGVEYGEKYLL